MNDIRTGTADVPGATLHYETRGTGPVLLLIPGGSGDAGIFDEMAAELADRYTVVSYDPRCFSRSHEDSAPSGQRVEVHSADARRILDLVARPGEPTAVLGTSSGAIVALDLLARFPDPPRLVIAHEPPSVELLPDAPQHRALFREVRETYLRDGVAAAMGVLAAGTSGGDNAPEPAEPQHTEAMDRMVANLPVFLEHILAQFTAHVPDLDALSSRADRLVLAAGRDSAGQLLRRPAEHIAQRTGAGFAEFPGGHVGATERPAEFAAALHRTLEAQVAR
ncbi:Pimeloyl-ACP methyl ester carboxylesterase [Saccharopolyspora antimicrobica]|uniref:Pimeloyl-ACP methyl ester carboxylesterase n=1 Tax=Saccharopolyspora antimicrobica TaxID=455193 RepID=A0A1I4TNC3_9PSEU|nr:alpha/beta fold hydrolase [Saccharopolyspora antimicrobica]RKT88480.1 pimeloyl-ACP methyl ester carboxylesterase [Saccharopolyspora antimicrobica]SFM78121.1 Pimeloyl-ACP methyl ester carboxylesterase [Saccharopolyspora antimicrobica]